MDIERLSKSQIILLTLLVSFVTSIATGIVTVSLMEQAPPSIAQSVNRIVERTVERVVPSGQSAATVITREKTVIVKESDLISEAVARVTPSVARLYSSLTPDAPVLLGLGVVVDSSGTIATDTGALGENADAIVELSDGTRVRAFVTSRDKDSGVALLQSATTTIDGKTPLWPPATLGVGSPKLGQTVIALANKSRVRIAQGIITDILPKKTAGLSAAADIFETNISSDSIMPGGILANTDGEIIGMSTSASRGEFLGGFISSTALAGQSVVPGEKAAQ
ncbi:MAG: trypsin-like peptidase domain-containing protein [bacterium]|nr:trypsin-like peptidase domain-containing protein [bacterium]